MGDPDSLVGVTASALDGAPARRLSAPVARISHAALRQNVASLLATAPGDTIADLRRDALGHGVADVAATVLDAGIDAVLIDPEAAVHLRVDPHRIRTNGLPSLGAHELLGLPRHGVLAGTAVMSLRGRVVSTKRLLAGEGVSYGYTYRAPADTRIALVTGGYAQGIARALGNRVVVSIAGTPHPIIGRVAMDVCVVDIGDADVADADEVVYFGDDVTPLSAWEHATGLVADELVTMIGLRAEREQIR